MIGRLLRGMIVLFACFAMGTIIAQAAILGYLSQAWHLDRNRLVQMLAVAQGVDLAGLHRATTPREEPASQEQASYEAVLQARAIKSRDLELREQGVRNAIGQVKFEQGRLAGEKDTLQKNRQSFEQSVTQLQKQATEAGWDENRRTLLALKPKQAKELLEQMLEKKEIEAVVALLTPMPDNKRAKILGEFKTPEEVKQIDEVLRLIRRGEPTTGITAAAQQQLGAAGNSQGNPQ